jgi:sugar phosphate isomerase/epimerase
VVAVAADLDVWPVLETHDSHPRGVHIAGILHRVDQLAPGHRVGAIWDVLHPWRTGENPATTWQALHPYLLDGRGYVQIKDVASTTVLTPVLQGTGIVPLNEVLKLLADGGYRGPLSLEWERTWYPEVPTLSQALPAAALALTTSGH